jgi:hypothetical protein
MTVSTDRILELHELLAAGGTVQLVDDDPYQQSVVLAVVRWLTGQGADGTDTENGMAAWEQVVEVLGSPPSDSVKSRPGNMGDPETETAIDTYHDSNGARTIVSLTPEESARWMSGGGVPLGAVVDPALQERLRLQRDALHTASVECAQLFIEALREHSAQSANRLTELQEASKAGDLQARLLMGVMLCELITFGCQS